MTLTEDDFEIEIPGNYEDDQVYCMINTGISYKNKKTGIIKGEQIKSQILADQKLRERIVDLADLWDGRESMTYGVTLKNILSELGIDDTPTWYKNKFLDKSVTNTNKDKPE